MRHVAVTVVALLFATAALAADLITIGETVTLTSKVMSEERTILVSTPAGYAQSQERYPVLYMTDGNAHFLHTRGTVDFLSRNGLMPDLIIVSVNNTNRTRDLSPTRATRALPDGSRQEIPDAGGADRFLDFFAQELIPYVEKNYRTAPYRLFAGHSLGGLLALHIFSARPDMFNAVIAASPALNWNDDWVLGRVAAFLKDRRELPRTLYVTMADEEQGDPSPTRFEKLYETLRASKIPGFVWGAKKMTDEDHGSVVLRTHYQALRLVFEGWRLPAGTREKRYDPTLGDVKTHYASLSKRLGYEIRPPELVVNQVGYRLLAAKRTDDALAVFRANVEMYPASANVYDSLAEALEGAGQVKEALENYERAVARAKQHSDARLNIFVANRDRAVAKAAAKPAA